MKKAGLNLPVKKLDSGKYLFGSKQISAKIIKGELVIRVGEDYMSVDEFIKEHGQIEIEMLQDQMDVGSPSNEMSDGILESDNQEDKTAPIQSDLIT